MTQDRYQIQEVKRGTTEHGSSYYDITALDKQTGEQVLCTYFGNTVPKRLIRVETTISKSGETYYVGVIQPHTSRDKKTGKFISGNKRTRV